MLQELPCSLTSFPFRPTMSASSPEGAAATVTAAYRQYFPLLRNKCSRALGDMAEAEEVAQETFIRLWRSGLALRPPGEVVAWLYWVSTRLLIDKLRARQRRQPAEMSAALQDTTAHPAPSIESVLQVRQQLQALAASLPAEELEVALLHRLDGLTQAEIGEVTGLSDRTVRRILTRLEARLGPWREEER
ncbi:RNA polymerase sigma factor [Archangium lipolyticum]|uniref:RNA polymerase sigma factor n=1 Tax=Archangium lipolyticum TaxID=2970465 RepID=UPI002149AF8E|nr:RNA polymerase sigma factor [Archangium lipolyticum]